MKKMQAITMFLVICITVGLGVFTVKVENISRSEQGIQVDFNSGDGYWIEF